MIYGLTAERVRELTADCHPKKTRVRRRGVRTKRSLVYGWLKVAVANIPPDGFLVGNKAAAEKYQTVARRMGIKVTIRIVGKGPTRIVAPALTGAEVSLNCSGL